MGVEKLTEKPATGNLIANINNNNKYMFAYFCLALLISYILYRVIVDILPRLTGENDLALVETVTLLPATICLPGMRMMTLDNFKGNNDIHNRHRQFHMKSYL